MLGALAWVPAMWMAKHPGMAGILCEFGGIARTGQNENGHRKQCAGSGQCQIDGMLVPGFWMLEAGINSQLTSPT